MGKGKTRLEAADIPGRVIMEEKNRYNSATVPERVRKKERGAREARTRRSKTGGGGLASAVATVEERERGREGEGGENRRWVAKGTLRGGHGAQGLRSANSSTARLHTTTTRDRHRPRRAISSFILINNACQESRWVVRRGWKGSG